MLVVNKMFSCIFGMLLLAFGGCMTASVCGAEKVFPATAKRILFLGDSITHAGDYIALVETQLRLHGVNARLVLMTPPAFDPLPLQQQGKLLPLGEKEYSWKAIYEHYDTQPLARMQFTDRYEPVSKGREYRVFSINTAGLESAPAVLKWKFPRSE